MDILLGILTALEVDKTVFYQFIIFAIAYGLSSVFFLKEIQRIIENRVDKIMKLEKEADKRIIDAKSLQGKYNSEIQKTNETNNIEFKENKKAIQKVGNEKLDEARKESDSYVEEAQRDYLEQVNYYEKELDKEVSEISKLLVNKITK
jgi:F0F1-type ATP synthase membrane subunit b/b'